MVENLLVERERETIFLEAALAATVAGQTERPRAIFLTGPVGRGRTSLLKLAGELAAQTNAVEQWGDGWGWPTGGVGPEVLRSLVPAGIFNDYDARQAQIKLLEGQVEKAQLSLGLPRPGTAPGEERLRAVQAIPPQALHFLIRRLYTSQTPEGMSEQAAAFVKTGLEHIITLTAANLSQLRTFVDEIKAELSQPDWALYLRPEEGLATSLGQSLAAHTTGQALLITIRDYVLVEGASDRWLRQVIEQSGRTLWLFTAHIPPGWHTGWLAELPLAPLSTAGIKTYLKKYHARDLSESELNWLNSLTGGEPLMLSLVAGLWLADMTPTDLDAARARAPNDGLDGLFLYFVEESNRLSLADKQALYTRAILRRPSADFLTQFAKLTLEAGQPYDPAGWSKLVQRYPWLVSGGELHPALQIRLREYLLVERRRFAGPVQEGIIEPARTVAVARLAERETTLIKADASKGSLSSRSRDNEWGSRVAEVAYYRFWLDEAVGWFFVLPRWLMALAYNEGLAHLFLGVAEEMSSTFYVEGQEILPFLRTLMLPGYTGGRARLDQKFKALQGLEELGTTARGRWYRAENLGQRPASGGSPEAELKGLLKWFQARLLEEAGQYERVVPLFESVLATNVSMPEMERATARAALYLAARYRLKGAAESAYSALNRSVELDPGQPLAWLALFYQSVRSHYPQTALKAADALSQIGGYEATGELFTIFALYALDRQGEVQTELRRYLARPADQTGQARSTFEMLLYLADSLTAEPDAGRAALLAQLPA